MVLSSGKQGCRRRRINNGSHRKFLAQCSPSVGNLETPNSNIDRSVRWLRTASRTSCSRTRLFTCNILHLRYPRVRFAQVLERYGHFWTMIAPNCIHRTTMLPPLSKVLGPLASTLMVFFIQWENHNTILCLGSGLVTYVVSSTLAVFTGIR